MLRYELATSLTLNIEQEMSLKKTNGVGLIIIIKIIIIIIKIITLFSEGDI